MLKSSVFLKLLAAVLCVTLLLTLIAVVAKKSGHGSESDSKVNTPTEEPLETPTDKTPETSVEEPATGEPDDPIIVDDQKTIVAMQGMNSYVASATSPYEAGGFDESKVFVLVVPDLKPGTKYKLVFSISKDSMPTEGCECMLGVEQEYLLALSGNDSVGNALKQSKTRFVPMNDSGLPEEETIEFIINDDFYYVPDSSGKAAMVFLFATVNYNVDENFQAIAEQIENSIVFRLYEITESGT